MLMDRRRMRATVLCVMAIATAAVAPLKAQTLVALSAPEASDLVLTFSAGAGSEKARFFVQRDDRTPEPLVSGAVFLGSPTVAVLMGDFNPLRRQVVVTSEDRDDETSAKLAELLKALGGIPSIIRPQTKTNAFTGFSAIELPDDFKTRLSALGGGCDTRVTEFLRLLNDVTVALNVPEAEPEQLLETVSGWADEVDRLGGREGVKAVRNDISGTSKTFAKAATDATKSLDVLDAKLGERPDDADACGVLVNAARQMLQLSDARDRVRRLTSLSGTLADLAKGLQAFENGVWQGRHYLAASAQTESGKVKTVTIKLADFSYSVGGEGLATEVTALGSTVMEFRRASFFVPEVGAGVVVSNLSKPKFGTKEVDGKTVVAVTGTEKKSYDAALIMNFLMRTPTGSVVPMVQVGAAADEDAPTILAGFGLRILGLKGVAFSAGWALGWVRDLDPEKLKENDPVSGTAQIEAALTHQFQGFSKWYFTVQYNFGSK